MGELTCALFPLGTVLFPGGPLPLRIFETRYLDMISDCLRNEKHFGVCLISAGQEAGKAADAVAVGTLARIVDWNQLSGGILGITARGEKRFRVQSREVQNDQLIVGEVSVLEPEERLPIPDKHQNLIDLLRGIVNKAVRV